jgi:Myosin-like coiled-coil protein
VRARLKDVLRQYELRERHFECVIRSKELEVLLSRARAAEQKQLAEGEKVRAEKVEEEVRPRFIRIIISILFFWGGFFFRCYFLVLTRLITKTFFRQNQQLRKELDDAQKAQTMLVERLISCCKEVRESFHNTIPLPPFPARFAKEKKNFFGHRV